MQYLCLVLFIFKSMNNSKIIKLIFNVFLKNDYDKVCESNNDILDKTSIKNMQFQ